jgi:radical SAM protein with 4Fe4S-binding SPASM domain
VAINWFDEKLAGMANVPNTPSARCGFGVGEIAVAPSGWLYPCERVIGEDRDDNPMRLPGHVTQGKDFLGYLPAPEKSAAECDACTMTSLCDTTCRCSNYIRTGRVDRPDGLLCMVNQCCAQETQRVVRRRSTPLLADV